MSSSNLPAVSNVLDILAKLLEPKLGKNGEKLSPTPAQKQLSVVHGLLQNEKILYHRYEHCFYLQQEDMVYHKLESRDLIDLVKYYVAKLRLTFTAKEIGATIELMSMYVPDIKEMPRRFMKISKNLYWDRDNGTIVPSPNGQVFYSLFDTTHTDKHVVKVPPFTEEQEERLMKMYNTVLRELEDGIPDPERFKPLVDWAKGSHDIYLDLHRAHAYSVLKKLPMGVYILIGGARGGKSSYTGMTTTIFGDTNTSKVALSELGEWHGNTALSGKLINAPDEDEDVVLTSQALFKTMADHGTIYLKVMRQQERLAVNCNFMCFVPMNHTPKWEGSGAQACMRRSLIIPFNNDLGKVDNTKEEFAQETFTADFMADYLGSMFAYANYYHRHDFEFSPTMLSYQESLSEEISNYTIYLKSFYRYFDSYTSSKLVYRDYQCWCAARDLMCSKMKDLTFHLSVEIPRNSEKVKIIDGKRQRFYSNPKPNHFLFSEGFSPADCPEIPSVKECHERGCSIVEMLDMKYIEAGVLKR